MKTKILLPALGLALSTAVACTPVDQPTPGFGDSVRNNILVQSINPEPTPTTAADDSMDGGRAQGAVGRYQAGKTYRPSTSSRSTSPAPAPAAK